MLVSWDTEHAAFVEPYDYERMKPLTCVSYAYDTTDGLFHARHSDAEAFVRWVLDEHVSVGANIAHDMAEACFEWPHLIPRVWQAYEEGRVRCLIQTERLISTADGRTADGGPRNLDLLAQKYGFGILDKDPAVRLSYGPLRDVPLDAWSERHRQYPVDDARAGLHVALRQVPQTDWENASRADFLCELMGAWGFRTDPVRVARLEERWRQELDARVQVLTSLPPLRKLNKSKKLIVPDAYETAELLRSSILRPNPANVTGYSENERVTKARVLAAGGTRLTKGGTICCDAEALEISSDPILRALADYNSLQKRLGADIPALKLAELHCWFKPVQTNNQTSCSNPWNAQNPPTEGGIRECVIPRPGMCFIDSDFNLFQLRTFAQVCLEIVGRSDMADVLNNPKGPNLHGLLASKILGIPYEQYDKKKDRAERGERNIYDMSKRCNFGFGADMGCKRFQGTCSKQGVYVTEQEFWKYKNAWKQMWPEAQMYFDYIQSLGDGATITELFTGRQRGGCSYPDAANGYFSALAASAGKAAWWRVARECYDPSVGSVLYGDRPINWVHDQLLIETPRTKAAHDHAMRVKEIMETETRPFLPDVPATTDPCLSDCWSKGAEAVFDKNERLVVWEYKEAAA